MRKILIYMVLFFATSLMAAEVNWAKDFQSGLKQAKEQNKPMLFVISRDTCKYCIILKNTTFKDEKVTTALNKDFIAVTSWINENDYVPERLFTPGLPGIWFLLPSGEPMFQPLMGAQSVDDFLYALGLVKAEFDKLQKKVQVKAKDSNTTKAEASKKEEVSQKKESKSAQTPKEKKAEIIN